MYMHPHEQTMRNNKCTSPPIRKSCAPVRFSPVLADFTLPSLLRYFRSTIKHASPHVLTLFFVLTIFNLANAHTLFTLLFRQQNGMQTDWSWSWWVFTQLNNTHWNKHSTTFHAKWYRFFLIRLPPIFQARAYVREGTWTTLLLAIIVVRQLYNHCNWTYRQLILSYHIFTW